jgi:hypothetical protein
MAGDIEEDFEQVQAILEETRGEPDSSVDRDVYSAVLVGAVHGEDSDRVMDWAGSKDIADDTELQTAINELRELSLIRDDDTLTLDKIVADEPHQIADVVNMLA